VNSGRTVFSQLIEHLPEKEFQKCVARYHGDSNFRGFSCWDQLLAMAFAQLTYRESLRDIESCLRALQSKLYHMGFRGKVSRSTLADANESHDWRIFADFAQGLIATARPLHACDLMGVDLDQSLYALDSTTIDLCLSLFPWAKFRQRKAAIKMHTLLDLHGNIPTFIRVTSGAVHDVNILDEIMPEAGAFYVMDRAYIDFQRLFVFTLSSAFFVVRTKSNVLLERRYSHPVDKSTGVLSDQTVILSSVGVFLAAQRGLGSLVLLQIIEIFQEQEPGSLLRVVEFSCASGFFAEHVINVSEGLFEHSVIDHSRERRMIPRMPLSNSLFEPNWRTVV
jgi:hypothetical protein